MENDFGIIEPCECGGVNLTMGPMTVHFDTSEFMELVELISAGIDMIEASDEDELIDIDGDETLN